jgi:peroxiredoxin Q/BCP
MSRTKTAKAPVKTTPAVKNAATAKAAKAPAPAKKPVAKVATVATAKEAKPLAKKKAAPESGAAGRLDKGDRAPEVTLANDEGAPFRLSSLKGKTVVLYFYPKADTSGCTKESIGFRDAAAEFARAGAVIVGASPDTSLAQKKFKTKYSFPFALLADVAHEAAEAYGAWAEKSMYGRTYFGVERSTFVIDKAGKIAHAFRKVKVDGHVDAVLAVVRDLK